VVASRSLSYSLLVSAFTLASTFWLFIPVFLVLLLGVVACVVIDLPLLTVVLDVPFCLHGGRGFPRLVVAYAISLAALTSSSVTLAVSATLLVVSAICWNWAPAWSALSIYACSAARLTAAYATACFFLWSFFFFF
jgi:hypothetical protein